MLRSLSHRPACVFFCSFLFLLFSLSECANRLKECCLKSSQHGAKCTILHSTSSRVTGWFSCDTQSRGCSGGTDRCCMGLLYKANEALSCRGKSEAVSALPPSLLWAAVDQIRIQSMAPGRKRIQDIKGVLYLYSSPSAIYPSGLLTGGFSAHETSTTIWRGPKP